VVSTTELIGLPLLFAPRSDVTIPGQPHQEKWTATLEMCSQGYFPSLRRQLLQGRVLTADDISASRHVAVVNEILDRKFLARENPIGLQIKFNVFDELPQSPRDTYFEIVGIVNDARSYDFEGGTMIPRAPQMAEPEAFVPYSVSGFGDRAIAMQTRVPPALLVNSVRHILWSMDHDVFWYSLTSPELRGIRLSR